MCAQKRTPDREKRDVMRLTSLALLASTAFVAPVGAQTAADLSHQSGGQTAAVTTDSDASSTETGLLKEPRVISRAVTMSNRWLGENGAQQRNGFYPDFGNMITGAGWISVGPGYRQHLFGDRALVDGSAAISWRGYKTAQLRFELPTLVGHRLAVGSQVRWQDFTQVDYFGMGPDSEEAAHSQFRLKGTNVVGYGVYQATRWLSVGGTFGRLRQPTLDSPTGPFRGDWPSTLQAFPQDPGVASQPDFLHGSASVAVDARDSPGHPTRGGVYRAGGVAYSDRDRGPFSFQRYDAEGLQLVPVKGRTWIMALHGWAVFSHTASGDTVPFYLLPSLGGQNTLRGYNNYRFHDRHMLLASAESRWALFRDIDAVAFFDAGNVAPRAGDLNLKRTSWGGGLRVHAQRATFARLDVGHSREGWQVFFRLDDPFALKRLSRRTAEAPFVP